MRDDIETRASFEKWYSDNWEWSKTVERDGRGEYRYAGAAAAWPVWKAASERAESMAQTLRVIHTWASSGCLDAEHVLALTGRELGIHVLELSGNEIFPEKPVRLE